MQDSVSDAHVPTSILLVDDEAELRVAVIRYLKSEGMCVTGVGDGPAMKAALAQSSFDLVILDLGLGHETGLDLLRDLRKTQDLPVIILTGKSDPIDRVVGLELGADDYVAKPFLNRELLARINAITRRVKPSATANPEIGNGRVRTILLNDLRVDILPRTLTAVDGRSVSLTSAEFDILMELVENVGKAVPRPRLVEVAHRRRWTPNDRSVDTHVHNLRRKMSSTSAGAEMILAVRSIGYVLAADVQMR